MIEDTYLTVWAEELVDTIVTLSVMLFQERVNNPVSVVEREYSFLRKNNFSYNTWLPCTGARHEVMYETLAKQNIVDVWDAMNFVP